MKQREPWQHEWGRPLRGAGGTAEVFAIKSCTRRGCSWQMLSRKDSNRYRNGPDGKWTHAPKDCKGGEA